MTLLNFFLGNLGLSEQKVRPIHSQDGDSAQRGFGPGQPPCGTQTDLPQALLPHRDRHAESQKRRFDGRQTEQGARQNGHSLQRSSEGAGLTTNCNFSVSFFVKKTLICPLVGERL